MKLSLKKVGGERLEVSVARGSDLDAAMRALSAYASGDLHVDAEHRHVIVPVTNGARLLADAIRDLDAAGLQLDDIALRRPTLDDVFLTLTGHAAEDRGADVSSHSEEAVPTGGSRSDKSGTHTAPNERIRA